VRLKTAIEEFEKGAWAAKSEEFVICSSSTISFCASERPPVPQSMTTRVARAERTSTQDVLPPYRRVFGPGVAMDPRVPQNCIRTEGLRVLHSCVSPSLHKAIARKTFPAPSPIMLAVGVLSALRQGQTVCRVAYQNKAVIYDLLFKASVRSSMLGRVAS
jgi:hypothetical protein